MRIVSFAFAGRWRANSEESEIGFVITDVKNIDDGDSGCISLSILAKVSLNFEPAAL